MPQGTNDPVKEAIVDLIRAGALDTMIRGLVAEETARR